MQLRNQLNWHTQSMRTNTKKKTKKKLFYLQFSYYRMKQLATLSKFTLNEKKKLTKIQCENFFGKNIGFNKKVFQIFFVTLLKCFSERFYAGIFRFSRILAARNRYSQKKPTEKNFEILYLFNSVFRWHFFY